MTGPRTTADAFGDVAAAMVSEHNATDVLTRLMVDCAELLSAAAVAILVTDSSDELSLLSSSSHRAAELEMLQIQRAEGPCVEAINSGERVTGIGQDELVRRWHDVGRFMVRSGFERVDAYPMRWHGRVIGGLNIFRRSPTEVEQELVTLSQAFADVATLVVVQSTEIPTDQISARVHEAIMARGQIEQAKGVLAHLHGVDMAEAYERLVALADERGRSQTETALDVVREQYESNR